MKRTKVLISLALLLICVSAFGQLTADEWDYVDLFYSPPPTGTEYNIDCSVAIVWQHQEGLRPWCVQVNTAIELAGVFFAAPVILLADKKPEFIERVGQRFKVLVAFNAFWSMYNLPTFRLIEILEATK